TVGFGYDLKTDDYKVVMIWSFYDVSTFGSISQQPGLLVEVYTLSSDFWTQINDYPLESNCRFHFERCFNGVLYWLVDFYDVCDAWSPKPAIIAFHLSHQVFQRLPMPDSFSFSDDQNSTSLVVLSESLALFDCIDRDQRIFDLWVMENEFGVNGTWYKILSIGPFEGIAKPLVFWSTDEHLLENENKDLTTKQIKNHLHTHYNS
ncbi:FBA_3 domain-containing protein, partial [Cephalotus follicularis]